MLLIIFYQISSILLLFILKSSDSIKGILHFKELVMATLYNKKLGVRIDEAAMLIPSGYDCSFEYDVGWFLINAKTLEIVE